MARRGAFFPGMTPLTLTSPQLDQLLSVAAAAARLDISRRGLYRLIAARQLPPPIKVGGSTKLCVADLAAYLERLKSERRL